MNRISQLWRKAVYSKPDIPSKKTAVIAVLYHNLDHPDPSLPDKEIPSTLWRVVLLCPMAKLRTSHWRTYERPPQRNQMAP